MMTPQGYETFVKTEELGQYARESAKALVTGSPVSPVYTALYAEKKLTLIKSVMHSASGFAEAHVTIPQEVEWLLDNWYIAEREGKCAVSDIKTSPRLKCTLNKRKRLIISEAAVGLIRSGTGTVTSERVEIFLDAFQDIICLSEAELAFFIPALRLELIACLADACQKLRYVISDGVVEEGLAAYFGRLFSSLRFLSGFDASKILESVNRVERTLRRDPACIYAEMDEQTRYSYRREIARLAEQAGDSEHQTASRILTLSQKNERHIGFYIFTEPLGLLRHGRTGAFYIGFIILASLFLSLLISFMLDAPAISILLLLPVSEFVKNVTDYIVLRLCRPQRIQRLELSGGVPDEGRTLCVISILLSSVDSGTRAAGLLEEYRLCNRDAGRNLLFGLLADLPDSKTESSPDDSKFIDNAKAEIERLNNEYGGGFFLFYRGRKYNARDKKFTAWERKRGAILELCRYLKGNETSLTCIAGRAEALAGTNYVITLDSDTRLNAGSARELIGAALHPLNKPVIDEKRGIVTAGNGIIQPRISVDLAAAGQTHYTKIFAGLGGIDPYGGMTSDIYQNLFGTGSFAGKGIIDIEAYLACLDRRFPENTVLSHDLLEGAYLRCSFAGDIELTDGFPAKVTTYYDRMHRWTRGDWQSLTWLFLRVNNADGVKNKNVLGQTDRWKIADNLRRSLVPVFTFAALASGMLLHNKDFMWAAGIAVLSAVSHLIISSAAGVFTKKCGRIRYHSTVLSGPGSQFLQTAIRLVFLPYEAVVCLSAILTALYRMFVSHRHLLVWVTAADSERRTKNNVLSVLKRLWLSCLIAAAIIIFTRFPAAAAVAVVWLLSPLLVIYLGLDSRKKEKLSPEERLILARCAGDIWRYFDELLTREDNYLPPDNFQEQPSVGIAHRTSPTNIGLAFLSALAAYDLGLCTRERAVEVVSYVMDTVMKLQKWNGHLYNWYDTLTLNVLQPAYVSAVDSGNLAGCLIALREGLAELGENTLAAKAEGLLSGMSFTPLFDDKRQLFYIGWDIAKGAPTEGWYDLLASEARQTSYIAIARGDIPRKHWRRLGRSLVAKDGYRGMASWTGTMFEYMMPELLLPFYHNSLVYESLKFCLYVQRKRAMGFPWGMSESAFYSFDHTLSYRYKAHGVQRLALKRGMGREAVVSPYSTFLALQVDPKAAVQNLRRLIKLGMEGRYGLYEAVDFTQSRLRNGNYEIVKTFMSHHLGMSLLAIDNVLKSGIMQRRFMHNREMASFAELLQEKVPVGGIILRQPPRDVPEKPLRLSSQNWRFECRGIDYRNPRSTLLCNGAYSVVIAETGQSSSVWNGVTLTKTSFEALGPDTGMSFYLNCGGDLLSLLPSPIFDRNVRYSAELSGAYCRIDAKSGSIQSSVTVSVPEDEAGELRTVEIVSSVSRDAELVCYFEPVLSRQSDYESHPAFSKLSLETSVFDNSVIIKRRPRAKGRGIAMAFDSNCPLTFDTSREKALGRGGIFALRQALLREPSTSTGAVLDPCVLARVKLHLEPDIPLRVSFALTTSSTPHASSAAAKRILSAVGQPAYSRLDETAHRLKLTPEQLESAMALLPGLIYASPDRIIPDGLTASLKHGQKSLWSLGISGDLPIVSVIIEDEGEITASSELMAMHQLLSENGVSFDLVYLVKGGGDYRSTLRDSLIGILRTNALENRLGARGGIHLADLASQGAEIVRAVSAWLIQSSEKLPKIARMENNQPVTHQLSTVSPEQELSYRYNSDNSFSFDVSGRLPYNAWCHMLTNEAFGYVASDSGTGHMWHQNARENKLNRWLNDSLATIGTERLELHRNGVRYSLFADTDGCACTVTYGFGWAEWKKSIDGRVYTTKAFVPHDIPARVLIIETDDTEDYEVSYCTDLVLSPDTDDCVYVTTERRANLISARNTYNTDFPETVFHLTASMPEAAFTCSKFSWLSGQYDGITGTGFIPCAAVIYKANGTLVLVTGCGAPEKLQTLSVASHAYATLKETIDYWNRITSKLTVRTPSGDLDRYLNGWSIYQTLAGRIYGRSSLYQSGGAYGFRDQLQDICAVIDEVPCVAREHLLRAAAHQFEEGDVQHWWHPSRRYSDLGDKGVRTKCSDDLLWLPYALCVYVEATGDRSILDAEAPYIRSQPLSKDEDERYEQPKISALSEPLLSHAVRAVDLVLKRGTGRHGLCYIGSGDWNDGMNLVGAAGEGESVWLTWFTCITALKMASICMESGNPGAASRYQDAAEKLKHAAEDSWDGDWYKRGYYDDGSPLGSCISDECRIDSIAQSFAALANADPDKTKTALLTSVSRLFEKDERIVRLFDPPFSDGSSTPGYIKGYSPGFRENGGQYTHGAVWLAMGLLLAGMTDAGWEILEALLPPGRPNSIYRTEPYVIAADVYSAAGHMGRGGWTWYTGAAGWFRRVALENLLGLRLRNGVMTVEPALPSFWDGFEAVWLQNGRTYHIDVKKDGSIAVSCDSAPETGEIGVIARGQDNSPIKINN
jgi:cyclic beta-1,2-glucan synthetase